MKNPLTDRTSFTLRCLSILLLGLVLLVSAGCDIEESELGQTGSIEVMLTDLQGEPIADALIRIDGRPTTITRTTPVTIDDVEVGIRTVSAFKPGYIQVEQEVEVRLNQTAPVEMTTRIAPVTEIILQGAPAGTVLLLDGIPFGTTPERFDSIGTGTFTVSAYLEGHATDLPAEWIVTLSHEDTLAVLTPTFTAVDVGNQVDQLAPIFDLPSLGDSINFSLADYRGKVVLVSFFFYHCAPCLAEFPDIQEVYEDPSFAHRIEFFGVDGTDPWAVFNRYLEDHPTLGLEFPLLHDAAQTVRIVDYEVVTHPTNLLIDQTGVIRYRWGGVTQEVLRDAISSLLSTE